MIACKFELVGSLIVCQRCGCERPAKMNEDGSLKRRIRRCDVQGLGTWIGFNLDRIGITKDRYNRWMKRLRLVKETGKCSGCVQREYLLDKLTPNFIAKRLFRVKRTRKLGRQ